jgi:hypothetical protein
MYPPLDDIFAEYATHRVDSFALVMLHVGLRFASEKWCEAHQACDDPPTEASSSPRIHYNSSPQGFKHISTIRK